MLIRRSILVSGGMRSLVTTAVVLSAAGLPVAVTVAAARRHAVRLNLERPTAGTPLATSSGPWRVWMGAMPAMNTRSQEKTAVPPAWMTKANPFASTAASGSSDRPGGSGTKRRHER